MKHIQILFAVLIAWNVNAADDKTKLIEKVEKSDNYLVIPYEKYELPNGLTLVIHEDHSDPIVHVDVTYYVGSSREQVGRSGFAHFFEHMMFNGSDNVADEEHFAVVTESGGELNGSTNTDRTNYYETLPSNQLERALWLEADRMGFLLDAVTQEKFEIQRATVKNERGERIDNRPYGRVGEKVGEAIFPEGHPYSWPVIGYIEDLNRVDVNDLKKFFLRWYGPNNATLTVAGDVNPVDVVKMTEKYFGAIPRGPEVERMKKQPATLDKDRYISYEDNIRFPMLQVVVPSVPNRHEDEPALDILADVLGGGKNSVFYQHFVKGQKALQTRVGNPCRELSGQFTMTVLAFPGTQLSEVEKQIDEALKKFEKRGVTDEDIAKYKMQHESYIINTLQSVHGKAGQLAYYETFTGNPNYTQKSMAAYNAVTKEDVMKAYEKYVKGKPAVILSVYPKGQESIVAKKDNYTVPVRKTDVEEGEEYKKLVYNKAKDDFDRSVKPPAGKNPVVKVPDYWTSKFDNGIKLIGAQSTEVPKVTLLLSMKGGHRFEEAEKVGVASLMTNLMNESTTEHSAEELSEQLELLGSNVSIASGDEEISVTISCLTKNLDATLKIAEEMLMKPAFKEDEFMRAKKRMRENIANQSTQPRTIARNAYRKILYGEGHIMSIPSSGTVESVEALSLEDVKNYYAAAIAPTEAKLVVVGDIKQEEVLGKLDFLKNWTAKSNLKVAAEPALPKVDKTKIYLVDKENAPQSELRIGYMALPYDATGEFYRARLMSYNLGGNFNSRMNLNLREGKGYTYGARNVFGGTKFTGAYTAYAGVRGDATDSSIIEFMKEIKNFADKGIQKEELEFMKSSIGQSEALEYETPGQKAGFLKRILDYDLQKDYIEKQNEILANLTAEEVNASAKKYLPYDQMNILVVGDKDKIYDGLSKLGYDIIELDAFGNPVDVK